MKTKSVDSTLRPTGKYSLLFLLLLLLVTFSVSAQEFSESDRKERLYFGGDFGLLFGTETYINLSPLVAYRFTGRLDAGLGPVYQYYSIRLGSEKYSTGIYGGRSFVSYRILKDINNILPIGIHATIAAHIEDQVLNLDREVLSYDSVSGTDRIWMNNILIGGSFGQSIGKRSSVQIMVLWYLNKSAAGLYDNPVIRVGFNF